MALIKTPREIQHMREAGHLLGKILRELGSAAEPGQTTNDIEAHAEKLFALYQAEPAFKGYRNYPYICCLSVNENVVHGFPNDTPLQPGDLLTIDCGVKKAGLYTDAAISVIVGGDSAGTEKARKLNRTTKKALDSAIQLIKPGIKIGDLGYLICNIVESAGFSIIRELTGHGVGYQLHEDPQIFNFGTKGSGPALKPGMTVAIEPIVSSGKRYIKTLNDGWTIATRDGSWGCQWEHTVLVTENGHEILSLPL